MSEIWKPVVGLENYYRVSNLGAVFSIRSNKVLKPVTTMGYPRLSLSIDGKRFDRHVHRLVLEAFRGPPPLGFECAHLNGDRSDARLVNLRWVSRKENHSHKYFHGTAQLGEKASVVKLKDGDVVEIRRRFKNGETQASLAKEFGLHFSNVSAIVLRKSWKHLKD